jgi:hypothetical protein
MENRYCEDEMVTVAIEKVPLDTGLMQLATYVIQSTNGKVLGKMLEQGF